MFETKKGKFTLCILAGIVTGLIFIVISESSSWNTNTFINFGFVEYFTQELNSFNSTKFNLNNDSGIPLSTTQPSFNSSNTAFLVDTTNCKIPDLSPNDPSLRGVVKPGVVLHCNKYKVFTYDKGNSVFIDWKAVNSSQYKNRLNYCKLIPITRPVTQTSDHNALGYLPAGPKFSDSTDTGQHDHFHAKCFDKQDRFLFENYHTIIKEKKEVEERCRKKMADRLQNKPDIKETMNILVIVVDSVSRLNAMRFMKKTTKYLMNVLNATDIAGYNKVGYGTFHNMIPATTGKFYEELPWSFEKPNIFDKYRFVWDDYAANGYRTYYAEDYPFGALFDYKKPGFRKNPADYYSRQVFLSMYKQPTKIVYNEENCILNKLQTDWVLDPAYKFLTKFKAKPYFCFLLITRLTHDYLERTLSADDIYYNYFKKAYEDGLLNNTVVMFTADHGMRFGDIRKWYIGLMEERLPMLYVVLPQWFHKKYPDRVKNLKTNSRRLTTPFDVYETFQDLLFFTGKDRTEGGLSNKGKKRAYSLFNPLPFDRSCSDADIDSHWCTCAGLEIADVKSKPVKDAAEFFVNTINKQLSKVQHLCEILSIDVINSAYKIKPSSKTLVNTLISHKISFTAKPGGGAFEGTIEYDARKRIFKLGSEISRINAYGGEKRCNVNYDEERLCYCKANRQ